MNIRSELLQSFKHGTTVTKLIYLNVIVFLVIKLISVILTLVLKDNSFLLTNLAMPANWESLIVKPWTLITYVFTHEGFFHILFNVLNLYWFGRLFLMFFNQKQLVGLYILGGIAGGLVYFAAYNIFPYFQQALIGSSLLGASGAVLAIMMGVAAYAPNMEIGLMLIGKIKLKYLAAVIFFLSLFSVVGANAGGNMAHLGGLLMGYIFAISMKKGKDLSAGINKIIDFFVDLFSRKPKMKVTKGSRPMTDSDWNANKTNETNELNRILEKIKQSGYQSLSAEEKKKLFDQSNKP